MQLTTTATLEDGSEQDVTPRTSWTIYRTSNPQIATVNELGLLTGHAVGPVFITAVNDGATAVKKLTVTTAIQTTTVEGFVQLEDGTPVQGASVRTQFSEPVQTDNKGFFSIVNADVPLEGDLIVTATGVIDGRTFVGVSGTLETMADALTDAGIITLGRDNGLLVRFFDTPNPTNAVDVGFAGIPALPFTVTTATETKTVTEFVVPVVNFPDISFDRQAFYNVGANGTVDFGSTALLPTGDDISIRPPGGNDRFGASFTGCLLLPEGGDVTFTVGIDDAFDLIINGSSVRRFIGGTNFRNFTTVVRNLPAGPVPITLNYGEIGGEANVVLSASGGGLPGGVIPTEFLFPDVAP